MMTMTTVRILRPEKPAHRWRIFVFRGGLMRAVAGDSLYEAVAHLRHARKIGAMP